MKKNYILTLFFCSSLFISNAQIKTPQASPTCEISQYVGTSKISITYSRPGVKNRVIFGGLVPFDKVWRTGANKATKISFSQDVKVGGQDLEAGDYSLFTIPSQKEWTIIFNKSLDLWGTGKYSQDMDALRITVPSISNTTLAPISENVRNAELEEEHAKTIDKLEAKLKVAELKGDANATNKIKDEINKIKDEIESKGESQHSLFSNTESVFKSETFDWLKNNHVESFTMDFGSFTSAGAELILSWERTKVVIPIYTNTIEEVQKEYTALLEAGPDANTYYKGARFFLDNNLDMNLALKWIDLAIEKRPEAFWMSYQKAKILIQFDKFSEAIQIAEKVIEMAGSAEDSYGYDEKAEELIKQLKIK
ncbi:MAG: DUF2911 domain-containing protein [Flavobacteriales bacterium]|nr:DUF2911 domain-containing protein [Flavobacteriales bacterium]